MGKNIPWKLFYDSYIKCHQELITLFLFSPCFQRLREAKASRDAWGPDLPQHRREAVETHKANGTEFPGLADYRSPSKMDEIEMKVPPGQENV